MKDAIFGTNVLLLACLIALLAIYVSVDEVEDRLSSIDKKLEALDALTREGETR